ncbi:YdgA family protein [Deinococcus sp. HMF7604]|uniref:YdgA family protein n=1 Tax=Deinococcus betulae TaxID=2873312 RepID=UPI001CCB7553|nr:YdgA family protein [Deinococcus betulae]MBZ9753110.1 YdgA family protein [Deinococcus betulae]
MTVPPPAPTRPRARRRPLPLLLGVGALLLAGTYAGATALFSSRAQTLTRDLTAGLQLSAQASGAAKVEQLSYQRGLTRSTQTMRVTLTDAAAPVNLLVTNEIQHGPLPGFQAAGQAVIHTTVRFEDPKIQAGYERAFPADKPKLLTRIALNGDTTSDLGVPAGTVTEEGTNLTWQALKGQVEVRGLQTRANLTWPGLQMSGPDGSGQVGNVTLTSDLRRSGPEDRLGTGSSTLKLAQVRLGDGSEQINVQDVAVTAQSALKGEHYDVAMNYDIGRAEGAGQSYGGVQLHLGVGHLAQAPLHRLLVLLDETRKTTGVASAAGDLKSLTPEQEKQAGADLLALVKDKPVLTLDRLSLKGEGGEVLLTGSAALPGAAALSDTDLKALLEEPTGALGMLDVQANLQGSEAAMRGLLGTFGRGLEDNLDAFIEAGYLKRSGDTLSLALRLNQGEPTLNGQSMADF